MESISFQDFPNKTYGGRDRVLHSKKNIIPFDFSDRISCMATMEWGYNMDNSELAHSYVKFMHYL